MSSSRCGTVNQILYKLEKQYPSIKEIFEKLDVSSRSKQEKTELLMPPDLPEQVKRVLGGNNLLEFRSIPNRIFKFGEPELTHCYGAYKSNNFTLSLLMVTGEKNNSFFSWKNADIPGWRTYKKTDGYLRKPVRYLSAKKFEQFNLIASFRWPRSSLHDNRYIADALLEVLKKRNML